VEALHNKTTVTLFNGAVTDVLTTEISPSFNRCGHDYSVCFPWAIKRNNEKEIGNLNSNRVEWTPITQALFKHRVLIKDFLAKRPWELITRVV
jgi:hypothetical protein